MDTNRKIWEENWINVKAGDAISMQMIWRTILQGSRNIPTAQLNPILKKLEKASSAKLILGSISRCKEPAFVMEKLYETINHTSFSMEDWLNALEVFIHHCEQKNQKPSFHASIDYISCCAEWLESKQDGGDLEAKTEEMVNKFGWDGTDSGCLA